MRQWKKIGELQTVSAWTTSDVFTIEDIAQEASENGYDVTLYRDGYIEFIDDVVDTGYEGFLMNFEDIEKEEVVRINPLTHLKYEGYILEVEEYEKEKEIKWRDDLAPFKCVARVREMSKGIIRNCTMPDGTVKKVMQGAKIFDRFICKIEDFIIAYKDDYAVMFLIHKDVYGRDVLLKFNLAKWSWHLYKDKYGKVFLLSEDSEEEILNKEKEKYIVAKGKLYPNN